MEHISLSKLKGNPSNPRVIKDQKFKKLVKSIREFPKILEIRPIVVNEDMVILGGNMRLKACKEAGLKKVPVEVFTRSMAEEMGGKSYNAISQSRFLRVLPAYF